MVIKMKCLRVLIADAAMAILTSIDKTFTVFVIISATQIYHA